jgi:outer membrane receptor protein involved in Fe transport
LNVRPLLLWKEHKPGQGREETTTKLHSTSLAVALLTISCSAFADDVIPAAVQPSAQTGQQQTEPADAEDLPPAEPVESLSLDLEALDRQVERVVIVTARGFEEKPGETGRNIAVVSEERIAQKGGQTLPDALQGEAGIWVQKTDLGAGSPFLRGFTGKHTLILLDGVRFNNSTFRSGPNQYLNTIDVTLARRFEVLFGPGSVVYGSDAIGGVMNVLTWPTEIELKLGPETGNHVFTQYSSADQGFVGHYDYADASGKLWYELGVTYVNCEDLRAGRGPSPVGAVDINGVQTPSGYEGGSMNLSLLYTPSEYDEWRTFFTTTRLVNVPRSDRLIPNDKVATADVIYLYDPQEMQFGYVEWRGIRDFADYRVNISYNRQLEGRTRRNSGWTRTRFEEDEVQTAGVIFSSRSTLGPGELVAGAEGYFDTIASSRFDVADGTGIITVRSPLYPDGTTYLSSGAFADYRFAAGEAGIVDLGLRYSAFHIKTDFKGLIVGPVGPLYELEKTYQDVTWGASFTRPIVEDTDWYISIARGFRAPNVDDTAVNGDWSSGTDIPNIDLVPEKVINYEIGTKCQTKICRAGLSLYYADYSDLIARVYVDPGPDTIPGTTDDLFQYQNITEAVVYGTEASLDCRIFRAANSRLSFFGTLGYTFGENDTASQPLSKIPPLNGTAGFRLEEPSKRWWTECFVECAARQDRLSSADIADRRIPIAGTPGWATVSLRGGVKITDSLTVNIGLVNLGDKRYRMHGSGLDAPGANAVLSMDCRF